MRQKCDTEIYLYLLSLNSACECCVSVVVLRLSICHDREVNSFDSTIQVVKEVACVHWLRCKWTLFLDRLTYFFSLWISAQRISHAYGIKREKWIILVLLLRIFSLRPMNLIIIFWKRFIIRRFSRKLIRPSTFE